jgi:hypothetical protein
MNTLYAAESTQFYSAFLPTTISLTWCCRQKREVSLCFLPMMLNTIRKFTVWKTMLHFIARFWQQFSVLLSTFGDKKKGVIKNFKYLGEF